jgi:hypothetical protein
MFDGLFSSRKRKDLPVHYERPKCETKVKLAPEFFGRADGMVNQTYESGGNLQFDSNGELVVREQTTGQYSRIVMPRSIVDFHSHPGRCKKDSCALSIGSPSDMKNIAIGAMSGANGHFIFTKDGTFAIRVSDWKLDNIWDNKCDILQFLADIDTEMDALHRQFIRKQFNYKTYLDKWMTLSTQLGFDVHLFPPDEEPYIMVRHHCDSSVLNEPGAQQTLAIEDSLDFVEKTKRGCNKAKRPKKK